MWTLRRSKKSGFVRLKGPGQPGQYSMLDIAFQLARLGSIQFLLGVLYSKIGFFYRSESPVLKNCIIHLLLVWN